MLINILVYKNWSHNMKFKHCIVFFSLMLCFLLCGCVVASDVNDTIITNNEGNEQISVNEEYAVNYENDENQAVEAVDDLLGDEDNGTFTALQLKVSLASSGSTINLSRDYKYNDEFKISSGIFINKDLTINGNGHTIDGMNKSRIFNINYGSILKQHSVTLTNITFKNGYAKIYGGAILSFANLTVNNCIFTNNNAGTVGGAINSLGALTLKNSKFDRNTAVGDAGAVFSLTFIKGYEFYRNYFAGKNATEDPNLLFTIAMQAALEPGKDTIYNCVFTKNIADGTGGGAVYAFSHIDINSCTFNSNIAVEKGAAVFGCKDLYIKNSKFNKNQAFMYGGAVYFKCHEQSGHYVNGTWVSSIKFYNNLIEGSTFSNNVADERGGAIYGFRVSDKDTVHCAKAVKCTFSDNQAPKGKDIYGGTLKNCVYKNTKITLKSVKVRKSAKKLTLQAILKKGSSALKNKQVTFKFNGIIYKAKTNSKGIAKVTIKSNVLKKLKVGKTIKYQAIYGKSADRKIAKVYK